MHKEFINNVNTGELKLELLWQVVAILNLKS